MVVALTVTPALCLCCCATAPLEQRESPLLAWLQARLRRACWRRSSARPRRRCRCRASSTVAGVAGLARASGSAAAAELQGARLPDALADPAGHVASRRRPASSTRASKDLRAIPACATSAPTSGRRCWRDEVVRRRLRRELDQRRPERRLRRDAGDGPGDGRRLPGPLPRRADLPAGADQGGADRHQRVDRRAHLRPRPATLREQGRGGRGGARGASTGVIDVHVELAGRHARRSRSSSTSTAARRYGLKPGDVRRRGRRP